jgi:hypothetical protein
MSHFRSYVLAQALICNNEVLNTTSEPCIVTFKLLSMQWLKSNCFIKVMEKSPNVTSLLISCGQNGSNICDHGLLIKTGAEKFLIQRNLPHLVDASTLVCSLFETTPYSSNHLLCLSAVFASK